MRELKPRAWSKSHSAYCDFVTLDGTGVWIGWFKRCGIYLADRDIVVELPTGLKDKNGRKIYEGDIVKLCGKVAENKCTLYEVFWENAIAGLCLVALEKDKSDIGYLTDVETKNRYKIIGNIHENPELLDKKEGEA